ncbi:DUF3905 domain-containing protein [Paenibacillus aurantius]|uniref:DUF3905 domain-containing protein n=1 Tax=Paenibacillus aurantius TaxID=2918900 RepID=A0AA96LE80_9BACL|nr:DUF3905 domain-containing protein [Paenibacillus aurantius]WNQ12081.1 DUF3905 domain-containing protein [Paenibacillus aurantius]
MSDKDLDPFEIEFLPEFRKGRGPEEPFVNEYGVTIGDHDYRSENSPLENWTAGTDPSVMAGDEWVHPFKDIGFHTAENRDYFERGIPPRGGITMHPTIDTAYDYALGQAGDEGHEERSTGMDGSPNASGEREAGADAGAGDRGRERP